MNTGGRTSVETPEMVIGQKKGGRSQKRVRHLDAWTFQRCFGVKLLFEPGHNLEAIAQKTLRLGESGRRRSCSKKEKAARRGIQRLTL